jgi:hypothetical protein
MAAPVAAKIAPPITPIRFRLSGPGYSVSSVTYPAATDVRSGVTYGGGTYTGNLTLPAASTVESGIHFGANGTQYTGTLVAASRAVAYGFSR